MFPDSVTHAVVATAKKNKIEPEALLALVEVETAGKMFEQDGRTPSLLFERHVAYREARKAGGNVLSKFISAGLAIPKWDRATQYRDERTSAQRLALIEKARAIHPEVTNRSASWGLGQTMGFLCTDLGFANAVEMVDHMTGSMQGQLDCLIAELKHTHLIEPLNSHDWAHVARIYNGAGYAQNHYDTRIADAHKRWVRRLPTIVDTNDVPRPVPPEQSLSRDEIVQVQQRLRDLGYAEVGDPEGTWGTRTVGGISAFQAHEGLPVTGHYDDATREALNRAEPREVPKERETTTTDDLRKDGSKTIEHADNVSWWGKVKMWIGGVFVSGGLAEKGGLLEHAQDAADKANQAKGIWEQVRDMIQPLFASWEVLAFGAFLIIGGVAVYFAADAIKQRRVDDHRSGVHAGTED